MGIKIVQRRSGCIRWNFIWASCTWKTEAQGLESFLTAFPGALAGLEVRAGLEVEQLRFRFAPAWVLILQAAA